jgi:hypothetical protein
MSALSLTLVPSMGVTTELLTQNGVKVFNEKEIDQAVIFYETHNRDV